MIISYDNIKNLYPSTDVTHAFLGFQVLDIINHSKTDIVFINISEPELDGIKTIYTIKKISPATKTIGLSMLHNKYDVQKMFKAGGNGYLLKNTGIDKIENAIRTVINGRNYYTDEVKCFFSDEQFNSFKSVSKNELHEDLTKRELQVLILICQQYNTKKISQQLALSENTVEIHRGHIMEKTHSQNMIGLILYALEKGFYKLNEESFSKE